MKHEELKQTRHTPGPWKVVVPQKPLEGFTHAITAPTGAVAWAFPPGDDMQQADANAQLIAAAPKMLAALEAALALWKKHGLGDDDAESEPVYNQIVAAIKEAKAGTK